MFTDVSSGTAPGGKVTVILPSEVEAVPPVEPICPSPVSGGMLVAVGVAVDVGLEVGVVVAVGDAV